MKQGIALHSLSRVRVALTILAGVLAALSAAQLAVAAPPGQTVAAATPQTAERAS